MKRRNPVARLSDSELRALADAYAKGVDIASTAHVQSMAQAQADRVQRAFRNLQQHIRVEFTERDPYPTYQALRNDVLSSRRMYVYTGGSDTPLWSPEINWQARAVHDYDHIMASADFSPEGEVLAYRASARQAPDLEPLYLSEIVLQAAESALHGFAPGPQKVVATTPEVERILRSRRNQGAERLMPEEVLAAARVLHSVGTDGLMLHLAATGYDARDAMTLALTASRLEDA